MRRSVAVGVRTLGGCPRKSLCHSLFSMDAERIDKNAKSLISDSLPFRLGG